MGNAASGKKGWDGEMGRTNRRSLLFFKFFYYICGSSVFRCPRERCPTRSDMTWKRLCMTRTVMNDDSTSGMVIGKL